MAKNKADDVLPLDDEPNVTETPSESKADKKARLKQEKEERKAAKRAEKREKKGLPPDNGEEGKGGLKRFLPVVLGLLVVGGISSVIAFNVANVRTNFVEPALRSVPIVGNLIGPEPAVNGDNLSNATTEELLARIEELNDQIESLTEENQSLVALRGVNQDEIERLQRIEAQHLENQRLRDAFDRMIAEEDPNAFAAFYESIRPENLEILGEEALVAAERQRLARHYFGMFREIEADDAAKILQNLFRTDNELVVAIMRELSPEQAGAILAAMDIRTAVMVSSFMNPAG